MVQGLDFFDCQVMLEHIQISRLLLYFNMNKGVITVCYFFKKANFKPQKLLFLVRYLKKKMNSGSSGLSYIPVNLQKIEKIYLVVNISHNFDKFQK